ncbi:MAG: carboxypeptidase-like regulatory domain-containing protein, partial [Desulfobacterales bacterium]
SQFYQVTERNDIVLPLSDTPYFFDLFPSYTYPFGNESTLFGGLGPTLLRGSLHETDGSGITGAAVYVTGQSNVCVTDSTGQWVLTFPDDQAANDVSVRIEMPDGSTTEVSNVPVTQGRTSSLANTVLRGLVLNSDGIGISGATIWIEGYLGTTVSDSSGEWFYYFPPNQQQVILNVTAELPDGQSATQANVQLQPRETVIVPNFLFSQ